MLVAEHGDAGSRSRFSVDSLMDEISSRLNAVEQGVRERDAGCNHDTMLGSRHYKLDEDSQ